MVLEGKKSFEIGVWTQLQFPEDLLYLFFNVTYRLSQIGAGASEIDFIAR